MNAKFFRAAILSLTLVMTLSSAVSALNVFELAEKGTPSQLRESHANFNVKINSLEEVIDAETGETLYEYSGKDYEITNYLGLTPLFIAAAFNTNPESIKFLISKGLDVNKKTYSGGSNGAYDTPLSFAISEGNVAAVKVLLDSGAKPDIGCHWGDGHFESPFALAVDLQDEGTAREIINMLIKAGGNINAPTGGTNQEDTQDDIKNFKSFKLAYSIGGKDILPHYLVWYCNMHTDLMNAVINDNPKSVNILLDFKADPNVRDYLNKIALDYALELPRNSKLRNSPAFERLKKLTKAKTGLGLKVTHKGKLGTVRAENLNVREKPNAKSRVKYKLHEYDYVRIEKQQRTNGELWYYISNIDDVKGWASAKYIN